MAARLRCCQSYATNIETKRYARFSFDAWTAATAGVRLMHKHKGTGGRTSRCLALLWWAHAELPLPWV